MKLSQEKLIVMSDIVVVAKRLTNVYEEKKIQVVPEKSQTKDTKNYPRSLNARLYSFKVEEILSNNSGIEVGEKINVSYRSTLDSLQSLSLAHSKGTYRSRIKHECKPFKGIHKIKENEAVILFLTKYNDEVYLYCDESISPLSEKKTIIKDRAQ